MLSKLLKYEFKATARVFIYMYISLLLFSLINRFVNPFDILNKTTSFNLAALLSVVTITTYFIVLVGVMIVTLVMLIQRFYKNLLGNEGYLMFTLPVKPWMHIVSKLVTAVVWTILSMLTAICSILIFSGATTEVIAALSDITDGIKGIFGPAGLIILPVSGIITMSEGILMVYAAIALGHLFNKHRILASFGMYFLLSVISDIFMMFLGFVYFTTLGSDFFVLMQREEFYLSAGQANMLLLSLAMVSVTFGTAYFLLTNYILRKRLNLE